jgi:RNA polymerase sigma-70 factor (ECF subfamily)
MTFMPEPGPRAGPTDPLIEIYLERRANLVRYFAARTGSLAVAEDLAQELYLKIASRDPEVTAENPVALIYRIATNVMLDRARGETRAAARDGAWRQAAHVTIGGEDVAEETPADEAVASRQRLRQLVDAAADLPPQMQRAFRLHKLEGLSHAETAQAMGISVKSVEKTHLRRPEVAHDETRAVNFYQKLYPTTGGFAPSVTSMPSTGRRMRRLGVGS